MQGAGQAHDHNATVQLTRRPGGREEGNRAAQKNTQEFGSRFSLITKELGGKGGLRHFFFYR